MLNPAPVWLPNGEGILIDAYGEDNQLDVWRVPLPGDGEPTPFLATPFSEHDVDVSPDGQWIAFVSNSSGREEVYVRAIDGEGETWTISTEGGTFPAWRRDGRELFFVDTAGRIVAVPTSLTPSFSKGTPVLLFDGRLEELSRQYDVTPDAQRFILARRAPSSDDPIIVVLGWANEIESSR